MELLYIWIKKNKTGFLDECEYTFTPEYNVKYDQNNKNISIEKSNTINVFKSKNIQNISALVGENGTGKSTLLNFLLDMDKVAIEYENKNIKCKKHRQYIAVYLKYDEIIILNNTEENIKFNTEEISSFSKYDRGRKYENVSHIYISNGEYDGENNLKKGRVMQYDTLSNRSMRIYSKSFFKNKCTLSNWSMVMSPTKFNMLQSIFSDMENVGKFQSLLDINFYEHIHRENLFFLGKSIEDINVKVDSILNYIGYDLVNDGSYYKKEFYGEDLKKFEKKQNSCVKQIEKESFLPCMYTILLNLIGELNYVYDEFEIDTDILSFESGLKICLNFINNNITDEKEKAYFENAIKEIKAFQKLNKKMKKIDNDTYQIKLDEFYKIFSIIVNGQYSFILKYISITNLYMSSGERVILNLFSRIYFLSQLELYFKNEDYKLYENILLLIDEIDLYIHPEWQRQIILKLIEELNKCFKEKTFQIILTTHSPIVLSDIPTQNAIFLKREEDEVFQVNKESQTFGANIYNLYEDAFFLENGAVGEFAKQYINNIAKNIREKNDDFNKADLKSKISLIGESVIKKHLLKLLHHDESEIEKIGLNQKSELISFLEKQKKEIETQIKRLKDE